MLEGGFGEALYGPVGQGDGDYGFSRPKDFSSTELTIEFNEHSLLFIDSFIRIFAELVLHPRSNGTVI